MELLSIPFAMKDLQESRWLSAREIPLCTHVSLVCPLAGPQQRALHGEIVDAVFAADRHTQARHHAFRSDALSMPTSQVRDQCEIRDRKQRQHDCVYVHVSIASRTRSGQQDCW